jgi:ABC-type multidrug transport system ATPase subunit
MSSDLVRSLRARLAGGTVQFTFTKISGEARPASGTTCFDLIPEAFRPKTDGKRTPENLVVYARYFGIGEAEARRRAPQLLEYAGLADRADAKIDALSGGMKRRLTLARALVNDPDVLFLDEPTTGLDPQARHLIWDALKRLVAQGKTLILTTHFMDEAERLCDRLCVMDHGRIIALDTPRRLIETLIEPHVIEVYGEPIPATRHDRALYDPDSARLKS